VTTHSTKEGDIVRPCFPAIPGRPACLGQPHVVLTVWHDNHPHLYIRQLGKLPTKKVRGKWNGNWDAGTERHCNSWVTTPDTII
jgi:hypothetical protein